MRAGSLALTRLIDQGAASAQGFYQASDRLQARLAAEGAVAVSIGEGAVDHAVTMAGVFAAIAELLGLAAALTVVHGVTGPLRAFPAGELARRPVEHWFPAWHGPRLATGHGIGPGVALAGRPFSEANLLSMAGLVPGRRFRALP